MAKKKQLLDPASKDPRDLLRLLVSEEGIVYDLAEAHVSLAAQCNDTLLRMLMRVREGTPITSIEVGLLATVAEMNAKIIEDGRDALAEHRRLHAQLGQLV